MSPTLYGVVSELLILSVLPSPSVKLIADVVNPLLGVNVTVLEVVVQLSNVPSPEVTVPPKLKILGVDVGEIVSTFEDGKPVMLDTVVVGKPVILDTVADGKPFIGFPKVRLTVSPAEKALKFIPVIVEEPPSDKVIVLEAISAAVST